MKYKAILFDLDGTLMPTSNDDFMKVYLSTLTEVMAPYIDPKTLMENMWAALDTMLQDTTDALNVDVFFGKFKSLIGVELFESVEPKFDNYYRNEFSALKTVLDDNTKMIETIDYLKDKGYKLIIATNPMFPPIAVEKRVEFSGLNVEDFDYISNFEEHTSTKPHINYYKEVLEKNDLNAEDCLMVGNDMQEDMIAKELGMEGWIITDYLISRDDNDISDWSGTRDEFYERVKVTL